MPEDNNERQADININTAATVSRIETKVDTLLGVEERVQSLEKWRTFLTGAWAAALLAIGFILKTFGA